jgi:hypothetical protein
VSPHAQALGVQLAGAQGLQSDLIRQALQQRGQHLVMPQPADRPADRAAERRPHGNDAPPGPTPRNALDQGVSSPSTNACSVA